MRKVAREEYEQEYTSETNYRMLIEIYEKVLGEKAQGGFDSRALKRTAA